jgi:Na+/proline symporter
MLDVPLAPRASLHAADVAAIAAYLVCCVGLAAWIGWRRTAGHSGEGYALANRRLPWWLIGIADVATGDGADAFWIHIFFVGGFIGFHRFYWVAAVFSLPLAVFWARYFRRLHLSSPGHLFEVRYGGGPARGFRVFSALYGVLCGQAILIGYVLRGFAQSLSPLLGWSPSQLLLVFGGLTLAYTLLSGLWAVAYMDLLQFALVMAGRFALAALLLHVAGGLPAVLSTVERLRGAAFLSPYPPSAAADAARFGEFALDPMSLGALALFGLWSAANHQQPAVQKTLAARDERHAALGQLFNTVLSLAVRTLPLALIGLCTVALLPTAKPAAGDTDQWATLVRRHAPPGLYGFLLIGIIAGYTSTLAGLLNFGASTLLNDVYLRAIRPSASSRPREQVWVARLSTLLVALAGNLWAWLLMEKIDAAWINFMNSVVLLFVLPVSLLRWLWWRLNIYGEMVSFVLGFPLAYFAWFGVPLIGLPAYKDQPYWQAFLVLFGLGMAITLAVTLLTPAEGQKTLAAFYRLARPPGFWRPLADRLAAEQPLGSPRRPHPLREALSGLYTCAFAAALVLAMSAFLVLRWVEGGLLLLLALLLSRRVLRESNAAALTSAPEPSVSADIKPAA